MKLTIPDNPNTHPDLEKLFSRNDIWRGQARGLMPQRVVDSGHAELNKVLLNNGWPTRSLVEVCQRGFHQQEWLLFLPALIAGEGYVVLLNPPLIPFAQALLQAGLDLERVMVVQIANKSDFLASFAELARNESCAVLLAWQQNQSLSYTDLRKCLLATNEGIGLCVLFRPDSAQQQNSPASLRISSEMTAMDMQLRIFKQKGVLQQRYSQPIKLSLPKVWQSVLPYPLLDQTALSGKSGTSSSKRKSATIMPLRRGKR